MQPQALAHCFLILDILKRIPRRSYTSSTHLAEQLESAGYVLTRRTLQRWLDAIVQQYPIECDTRSKPFGYRWMDTAQGLNLPLLTATEALLLQLARSELGQLLPASALKSLAPLFDSAHRRLNTSVSAPEEKRWLQKVRRIPESLPLQAPRISTSVFETVSEALYHECSLHLHYRNARSKLREATVYPLAMVQQANRLYLVCRFDGYDNERILALPRIKQARLDAAFTYPTDFKLDAYIQAGHFGILRGPLVRLTFHINQAEGRHLMESPLSADQTQEEDESGYRITATLPETELLHRWLRSWGNAITDVTITPAENSPLPPNARHS
jgi:predicted DNA-binding transcriptional regulator YafY